MTIKTTRWTLDSCGCVVEFTWDDAVAQASRTHTYSNHINRCTAHSSGTASSAYDVCLEENQRKNNALQVALDNGPTGLYDTVNSARQLKPTITYNYSWTGVSPNRVLSISFTGITLTTAQKSTIQTAQNTRFGAGKVTVL